MAGKQRGSAWSINTVFFLYKTFGYKFIYYLMYFVIMFYFIFASNVKKPLKIYYKKLGIKFTAYIYYEHLRMFAVTMVDRFIAKYDPSAYSFHCENEEELKKILEKKTIVLFSHFGGWASSSSKPMSDNKINIVMQEALLDGIKKIEDSIDNKVENLNVIDLSKGAIPVSIEIANALSNNEIIAIMADRASSDKYKYEIDFLEGKGYFNENPFKIAYRTKTPLICYFVIFKSMQTYELKAQELKIDYTLKEKEATKKVMSEYVKLFEGVVRQYPNQWFNFYNFWRK